MDDRSSRPSGTNDDGSPPRSSVPVAVAMVAGALLTAAAAVIHLHLWMTGYRHIATIGPLFLLQAVSGFVLAVVVAVWHRWYVAAAGALFLLATAAGLVVSARYGLFGFRDSFGAPYAGLALSLEGAGAAVLTAVTGFLLRRRGMAAEGSPVLSVATGAR
jgi:hypothetical protein